MHAQTNSIILNELFTCFFPAVWHPGFLPLAREDFTPEVHSELWHSREERGVDSELNKSTDIPTSVPIVLSWETQSVASTPNSSFSKCFCLLVAPCATAKVGYERSQNAISISLPKVMAWKAEKNTATQKIIAQQCARNKSIYHIHYSIHPILSVPFLFGTVTKKKV